MGAVPAADARGGVSSDFRTRTLRQALDATVQAALPERTPR
jgi:hypothetical protein